MRKGVYLFFIYIYGKIRVLNLVFNKIKKKKFLFSGG